MISRTAFLGIAIFAVMPGFEAASAAGIDVLAWELQTQVELPGLANDGDGSGAPTNPFQETQSASAGISTAQSIYAVSWNAAGLFDFLIQAEHTAQGNPSGFSRSIGSIYLIPTVDSIFTIDAEYNYDLGGGDREALFRGGVWQTGVGSVLNFQHFVVPLGGSPRQGTLTEHLTYQMEAGVEYNIGYTMELLSFGGSPTDLSEGNGFVSFSIVPIPEPTSAMLLVLASVAILRIRRGHRAFTPSCS